MVRRVLKWLIEAVSFMQQDETATAIDSDNSLVFF